MFDARFPIPQANCLEKVMVVVDAVDSGCTTASSVAAALDVVDRQGAYYVNAAGFLGLLDVNRATVPNHWSLTESGEEFTRLDADMRVEFIKAVLASSEEIAAAVDDDDNVLNQMLGTGLSDTTGERRLACVNAWADIATDPGSSLVENVLSERTAALARASTAASAAKKATASAVAKPCPRCFLVLPLTGVCADCN